MRQKGWDTTSCDNLLWCDTAKVRLILHPLAQRGSGGIFTEFRKFLAQMPMEKNSSELINLVGVARLYSAEIVFF
jgi:hypothetical protein